MQCRRDVLAKAKSLANIERCTFGLVHSSGLSRVKIAVDFGAAQPSWLSIHQKTHLPIAVLTAR
jgi:hypothetical protein